MKKGANKSLKAAKLSRRAKEQRRSKPLLPKGPGIPGKSEQAKKAEALQASMRFAQATLDALTAYICVLDKNGAIITTNAAWRKFVASNQAQPQIVTQGANYITVCNGVIGPESGEAAKFAAGLRQVLAGRSDLFAMEYARNSPAGPRWFLGRVTRFIANGHAHIVVTHENITERKQAELSLKASEQKARAIFDQTFQFIGLMTTDGTLIEANRSALEFSGIEASRVLGKPFWETPWWEHSPELQDKVRQAVKKVAQGEFVRFEATHTAKDGILHYIDFSLKPVKDEAGKVIFLIPEGRDITERKQAEEEIRKLNESLEERVQKRTIELARANQELETLIRIASHDLRSPLVNIQGFNQLLNKACDEIVRILTDAALSDETRQAFITSREKAKKSLRFINAGVEKMNGLISGLLRLSQLGRAPLVLQPLDMNVLLQTVLEAMAFQIRTAAAEVTVDALPDCRADAALINQVFSNLLDNAIKYRDSVRPLCVRIRGHREDARMVYCVEDNGLGVAPEHQQKIWNLFYQLGPKGNGAGEGIGLPAVQRIVERHSGTVWMESEIGKGSRFFLALPAAGKETEP